MKKSKYTESQVIKALKENEQGGKAEDICRELGTRKRTFYNWRKKYSGMEPSQLKRLKELEEGNNRLKRMYAELSLDNLMLKMCYQKSGKPCC